MNIDFNVTDILPDRWWNLTQDVLSDKKFDQEEFETLFKETFEVLRYCACEDSVNKELIELIKDASGFATTRFAKVDFYHLAACELTEAMLMNCLQGETQNEPITKGKWRLRRSEIDVDFLDVDEMLFNFSQDFEWWDGIAWRTNGDEEDNRRRRPCSRKRNGPHRCFLNEIDVLPDMWWDLNQAVLSDKKFDKEAFIDLFNETFERLRYCACEDSVNKERIELIKDVCGFVASRFAKVDFYHLAACELTEAMLMNCLQGETQKEPITKGKWVLLTSEIDVDFSKVDDMLFNFSQDLEWWDGIALEDKW